MSDETCEVLLEGELTVFRAVEVRDALLEARSDCSRIAVDLSEAAEMDTSCIQLLLALRRDALEKGRELRVTGCGEHAAEALRLFGLEQDFALNALDDSEVRP